MNRKIADPPPPHPIPKYFSNEYSNENALLALGQFVTLFRAGLNLLNSRWWWYFLSLIQLVCNQWCMKNVNIFVEMPQEQDLWFRNFVEPPKSKAKWTTNFNSWHPMPYAFLIETFVYWEKIIIRHTFIARSLWVFVPRSRDAAKNKVLIYIFQAKKNAGE